MNQLSQPSEPVSATAAESLIRQPQQASSHDPETAVNRTRCVRRCDGQLRDRCAVCAKQIVDDHWFCRLPPKTDPLLLCSPACALRYFKSVHAETDGANRDWEVYDHFPVNGE